MDGKTALGASSPAKPALHIPDPLSTTKAATSSSHMVTVYLFLRDFQKKTCRFESKNKENFNLKTN